MSFERTFVAQDFPNPVVTVEGARAFDERARLAAGGAVAVILGGDEMAARVLEGMSTGVRSSADILATAASLTFPAGLRAHRAGERARIAAMLAANPELPRMPVRVLDADGKLRLTATDEEILEELEEEPSIGDWPAAPEAMFSWIARDYRGNWLPEVHIAILPTNDATEGPALLHFGGWNSCPPPELHVAALRRWRADYAAELLSCGPDRLEVAVCRRPQTKEEALELSRELYDYCGDLIDQGFGTLSTLAGSLMVSDTWCFWWD